MKTTTIERPNKRTATKPARGTKEAVMRCVGTLRPMSTALSAAYREILAQRRTATR